MQLWHARTSVAPLPASTTDPGYQLRASDVVALVTLVAVIILSPVLYDLAMALGIAR
jgi:hypothetical protein